MSKTKKNYRNNKGGKVIASGGYGCVFNPALKCVGASRRESKKISKLMTERHATQEYEEINKIKEKLDSIPNYGDYFLVNGATLCRPAKLTAADLTAFKDKCTALPKNDITKENVNSKLEEVMSLNIPNGGLPVDDYIYKDGTFQKIYSVHNKLISLLKNGIIPMNEKHIYHSDIKDSNVLIDDSTSEIKARLIDWGLTVEYEPRKTATTFPRNWRNRPLQFNVPFSVIIFTDKFYEKYTKYLKDGGKVDEMNLKPFVVDYLNFWMKDRGAGHYKFINEIMFKLYSPLFTSISEKSRPAVIETEITIPTITNYIVDVLLHYTKFNEDGSLNLREYLNEVYIKIVDIWGFINIYYPILELLFNNYFSLKKDELDVYNHLTSIYNEYLYTPRHEPISMVKLLKDLKELSKLLYMVIHKKKKPSSPEESLARGVKKTKTQKKHIRSSLFKRKHLVKRFKNPIFLTFK